MLPHLQELLAKTKDVTKIDLIVARGGLQLSDYTNILNTASCAIKIRAALRSADTPKDLPIMVHVKERVSQKLVEVANMIAGVIDFDSSRAGSNLAAGAVKHICVNKGVHAELDGLREMYANLPTVLTEFADFERHRLSSLAPIHHLGNAIDELTVCYLPQVARVLQYLTPKQCQIGQPTLYPLVTLLSTALQRSPPPTLDLCSSALCSNFPSQMMSMMQASKL